jgi:hypothetical protein
MFDVIARYYLIQVVVDIYHRFDAIEDRIEMSIFP